MAEQTNTTKAHATIVHIDGKAYLRDESGKTVPLQPGQKIDEQQVLVTANDGHVQLQLPNGELVDIGPARTVQIDAQILNTAPADSATAAISDLAESTAKIAAAIANGQDLSTELEATAAGLNGTGASEGHSFVQLLRIAEGVEPLAFNFGNNNFAATDLPVNPNTVQPGIQAVNDTVTLEEDGESRINVLGNDIGNNLKVNTAVANNGTVSINPDGTLSYKPNANFNGNDQITYTITDANGTSSTATVAVTVTPVNDLPQPTDSNGNPLTVPVQISTKEDTPIAGKVSATDPDGDTLTFTPKDQPSHGTVTVNPDGSYIYTPAPDYNGKDSFTVTVNDGKGGTAIITVNVIVDPVNDAPVGTNQAITTPEDTPITGKLVATDKDGDPLTFTAKDQPAHGTVTVKPDGSYEYTPAPDYNGKDSFTVTVNDGKGGTAIITVNVTVDPVNDAPVGTNQAITTPEDTPITGKLVATDKDGDPLTFTAKDQPAHGTVTVKPDGSYEYSPAPDYNGKDSFTVTVSDGKGGTAVITVDVGITPADDPANISGNDQGTVQEDGVLIANGKLTVIDKDAGQSEMKPQTVTNEYGTFSIAKDGTWSFTLDNSANVVQSLSDKDSLNKTYVVESLDGTKHNVVITINGKDDAAEITPGKPGDDAGSVKEDTTLTTGGTLLVNDKDAGQSSFQAQTDTDGTYGKFSIGTDGKWTYVLNNSAANVQALAEGETKTEAFTVKSADGTTSSVVVTVVGTNDAAVITPNQPGDDAGQVKEDTTLTTSGTLLVNDKDAGQSSFQAQTDTDGTYGKFSIGTDGKWTYTLNNNDPVVQALKDGDVKTETFTVKSADGTESTITVTVNGTNETATVGHGAVQEDTVQSSSGTLTATGGATFVPQTDAAGTYGKLTLGSDGKWTYTLNNDADNVQALKTGETKTESFDVTLSDGTKTTITIDVQGLDDKAVITPGKPGDDAGQVKEDSVLTTGGTLLVNDKDAGQSSLQAQTDTDGTYGKFSIGADGKWTYVLNNAAANVQALAEGETKTETFTVKSADGTTSNVVVTVVGTNDAAVITPNQPGDDAGQVKEDTTLTTSGTLLVNDKDAGQSSFQAQTDTDGTYGKFSIGTDGKWTYVLNNAAANVQALAEGETKTETFTVKSADGTTSNVVVTVVGTNDAAVITPNQPGDDAGQVKEDTVLTTSGTLLVNDKDAGQSSFQAQTDTDGTYGKFSIGTDGKWTYVLNNAAANVQALAEGETKTETFTVKSADGTTSSVVVTVVGTNDAAVITPNQPGDDAGSVKEDTTLTTSGTLLVNDKDAGQSSFQAQTDTDGTYGKFSIGTDGKWTYTLNNNDPVVQALKDGDVKTETFTVKSADGTESTITVTVNGSNETATVGHGAVQEDTVQSSSGTLTATGGATFVPQTDAAGTYGKLTLGSDGKWTYTLNNDADNVQALKTGETKTESFDVTLSDGTKTTITIDVQGLDDKAVITPGKPGDDAGQVKEDSVLTTSGTLLVNDKDAGQSSFQAQTDTDGTYGKFSIGTDGKWTYVLNNAAANVQALAEGETKTETFTVKSADGTTSNVVVTVVGTNDAAVITPNQPGDDAGQVKEDTTLTTSGTLLVNDKDAGQSSFQAQTDTDGTYGKFSIGADGKWTYVLNNAAANVQALAEGETKTETFTVKSADGTTSNVVVTVVGTNDAAVITPNQPGDDAGSVKEDTTLTTSGTLLVNDKDAGQSSFQAQTDTDGTYGKFSIGTDGKWTYTLNNNDPVVQALKDGDVKTETFTVKSADGTESTITVTVNGSNETATVGHGAVQEDTAQSSSGTLTATGGATFVPQTDAAGTYGKLTLGSDGKWTYTLNNDADNVQALKTGETKTESFDVTLSDGTKTTITIDVQGLDDKAVITPGKPGDDAGSVKEDTTLTTGGTLLVNDKDAGQSSFQAQTDTDGTYGKFSIGTDGKWTYTLNNNDPVVQALKDGDVKTETFTVKSADGTESTITVTVNGSNETATVGHGVVQEDTVQSSSGTLTATGGATFVPQTDAAGTYGKLTLGSDGKWTYTLNNDADNVQALKTGETKTESFDVTLSDGTKTTITIDVQGLDDKAVITPGKPGDDAGSVKEDTTLTTSGTLLVNDKDAGQSSFQAQTDTDGTYGKFSIGTDGKWTYVLNNAAANVQALAEGETKTETFTVKSADGTTSNVVVTVVGTNDAAVITPNQPGDDAGSVKEDTTLTTSGTLLVNDKDAGQSSFKAQTDTDGTYGKFSIGTDGKWTYTLNNNDPVVQALKDGDVKTETFTVKSADGTESTITVTVNGSNETATVGHGVVQEDTVQSSSGTLTATGGATFVPQTDAAGTYGKLTLDSDGKWTYTLNNDADNVQALKTGETKTESFDVTLSDGTKTTITIDVQGLDDKAVIGQGQGDIGAGTVKEDTAAQTTATGHLSITDPDAGQASFTPQTVKNAYGTFTLQANGDWKFDIDNSSATVQALREGQQIKFDLPVTSLDGTAGKVSITVIGTNDAAIIGQGQGDIGAGTVKEDTAAQTTATGHLSITDPDAGQASFTPQTVKNAYGTFTLQANGDWKFDIDNSSATVQALREGQQIKFDLPVTSLDGTAGKVSITVIGTNDAAIIGQGQGDIGTGTVKEDTPAQTTANGHLTITDKDAGEASFTPQTVKNAYGTFTLQANGDWKFDIDNSSTTVQALKEGEQAKFDLPVTSLDGTTGKVSITVIGTNDAPASTGGVVSGTEDTAYTFKWNDFNAADSDTAASGLSIRLSSLPADGVLQFNGVAITNPAQLTITKADIDAGKLTFVPDANESGNNSFTTAGTGDQKTDYAKFDYQVNDGSASSDKVSMVVDIKPVADMPVISIGGISLVNGSTTTVTPPKGNGLTQQYYAPDASDNLNTTTARTPTRIEAELEGKVPTSTTVVTSPDVYVSNGSDAPSGIATDSAYRVSGLVYLEEGKNYTFSGYVDDTSLLKIGGVELMNRPYDGYGTFTATPFVPGKSGYYTVEMIVYNASNVGAMDLNVSVNGGKAVDFNTSNFQLYSNLTQLENSGGLHSNLVATGDGGYYPQGISGQEDSFIKLFGLAAKLSDTDGSESLQSLSLTELKAGSTVFDGVHTYNVPADGSALNLKGWDLNNLQIRPPLNFFGEYKVGLQAVSVENSTGETATNNAFVAIQVANSNDAPNTSDDSASIREDSSPNPVTGNVLSNDIDVDGDKLVVQAINNNAANVGKAISGQFGQLTINQDGSYSYTLDNSNPRVNALNDRDTLSEKFTYTASDGKGGTSTATLTINIQGHTDPVVIMGSSFNDQIGDMYGESNNLWTGEKTEGTVIDLQLGGGAVAGAPNPNPGQRFQYTQSVDQVIDAGGGNDYVESGRGDDVIYAGDSDSAGYKFADILGHKLMTLDLGSLVDSSTQLFSAAVGVSNPKADVVNGGSGHDAIFGQSGVDLLYGHTGNDYLDGGSDNDALRGGLGHDVLRGGSGNDVLRGDAGDDVFLWMPGDQAVARGATAAGTGNEFGIGANVNVVKTATDVVMDFNQNTTSGNNDKLDMRDLLIGETHGSNDIGNLLNYLHVEKTGSSTVIHVSTAGEFGGGYNAAKEDQTIILQGVDLTGATDADILKNLLQNNKLIVD